MISKMIFTVLSYTDLSPLMELDDFISAIWNNKYYEAGEFEIICQTNGERLTKIVRNNYIALNGTTEIGVITSIQYSKDEDQGAIMTIKGSFAHALLNRRIIWDRKTLAADISAGIRSLINENAITPADPERKLTLDQERASAEGFYIDIPALEAINSINFTGDSAVLNWGTATRGIIEGFEYECTKLLATPIVTTSAQVNVYMGGEWKYFSFSISSFDGYLWDNPLSDLDPPTIKWDDTGAYLYSHYKKIALSANFAPQSDKRTDGYTWDDTNLIATGIGQEILKDGPAQSDFICNRFVTLTKEEFENGGYGVALYDNRLHARIGVPQEIYDYCKSQWQGSWEEQSMWDLNKDIYICALVFGGIIKGNSVPVEYRIIKNDDFIVYNLTEQSKTGLRPQVNTDESGYYWRDLSITEFTAPFRLELVNNTYGGIFVSYTAATHESADFLQLGTAAPIYDSTFSLEVYGDNLLDKAAEILKPYGAAIRSRYDRKDRKIFIDIYKGGSRGRGSAYPVIYAEDLDNLNSYEVASANTAANFALVYSEKNDKEYKAEAGIEAGNRRFETFINRTDSAGYTGAIYQSKLIADGKISLSSLTLAITADVDTRAYSYRDEGGFSLGDIVTIIINDLNLEYNVRVLEVREYQDETGYNIDLVLGE